MITIIATADANEGGSSRTNGSSGRPSPSGRRPQDFYFDIKVTPLTEIRSPPTTSKKIKNRLRAFEMASLVLRDAPVVSYDPLDAYSNHVPRNYHPSTRPTSYTERPSSSSSREMLDFGNNSDSRMLSMRREKIRRESAAACDPSRHWGDLTHHHSSSELVVSVPTRPPTYSSKRSS